MTEQPATSGQQQGTPQDTATPQEQQSTPQGEETINTTQAELNRMMGQRARRAAETAEQQRLSEFEGASSWDDLKAAWQEKLTVEEAIKTEADREREAREAAERERDSLRTLADERLIASELRIALIEKGVPADRVADAAKLVDRDSLSVSDKGEVEGLDEAVKATVESRPWLIEQGTEPTQRRKAPDTTPNPPAGEEVTPGVGRLRHAYGST
jgi:hypothetical protein